MSSKSPKASSNTTGKSKTDRGVVKPLMENGLPPGISKQRAADPGNTPDKKNPVRNES